MQEIKVVSTAIAILVGVLLFLCGCVIGWFLSYFKYRKNENLLAGELHRQIEEKDRTTHDLRSSLTSVQQAKTIAETRLEETNKSIEEQRKLLEQAQEKLTTTFQALSGESLKSNSRAFLELAKENLAVVLSEAKGELGRKEEAVKNIVKPLEDVLKRYEKQINEIEKTRITAYSSLESQIKSLISSEQQLQKETGSLVAALKKPEVRGRWGEITLKRVVELLGMSEHCDYTEQVSVNTEEGRIIPDLIIHLPAEREVVVDSKVSLDAYLDAVASETDDERKGFIKKHAQQVRKHMKSLSEKNYWKQFTRSPEFVVMFMPGDSFLSAALENDHALIEDGMKSKVIIATPATLFALLRAIAYGWRQEQIAKSAQEIANLGKEMYDRFQPFLEHVNKMGGNLSRAVDAFNEMVGSLEHRVMISARKFKELGVAGKEFPEIQLIEKIPIKSQTTENQTTEKLEDENG
jgi:DNA recombination protein RmuC